MQKIRAGFTLVEMMVIAPIVILLIGAFIALIVNLTGEVLSSRGSNVLTYDVQDALNRIEQDVKLSTTFLATNSIDLDGDSTASPAIPATRQGYGGTTANGSTVNFSNVSKVSSGGSPASLILNSLVTNANPLATSARVVYLANRPNPCTTITEYSKNTPMTMNIVYFVDANNTLWRRTLMPHDYNTTAIRCGAAPWQQPSCMVGYSASLTYCKTNDVKLVDGVRPTDFNFSYFSAANGGAANDIANDATASDASRNTALQSTPTVLVSISAKRTIAGREISQSGSVRATRLDTNASSIAIAPPVTSEPVAPRVSSTVSDGHRVNFTWPQVGGATSYDLRYRVNGGAWTTVNDITNANRTYTVTAGWHQDTVEAEVRATNSLGDSPWQSNSLEIPLWAPLILKAGWTDYAGAYATAAYTRTKSGVVVLKGLVKNGTGVISTLPADYRPDKTFMFATSANGAIARADVRANGEISPETGSNPWYSLDGIAFMPAGTTYTALTYANSWTTHSTTFPAAGYATDASGRVHLRGLIKGGSTTVGVDMVTLPAAINTTEQTHWLQITNNTYGHISIVPASSSLPVKNGTNNSYLSMNAIYYPNRPSGTDCSAQWCALSLQNGWIHYGSPHTTPAYTKASDDIVHLKGLIRSGANQIVGFLPAGFCPAKREIFSVISADNWGRVDIVPLSNGTCQISGNVYSTTWLSLDSIRFIAER